MPLRPSKRRMVLEADKWRIFVTYGGIGNLRVGGFALDLHWESPPIQWDLEDSLP